MNPALVGPISVLAYCAAAGAFAAGRRAAGMLITVLALCGHASVLWPLVVTTQGVNFGVVNAASIVGWCIASLVLALNVQRPLESLAAIILPVTGLALGLDLWLPSPPVSEHTLPLGMYLHIALSIVAYSLIAIAATQALLLMLATRQLRQHHPIMHFLPPLPTMEAVMYQLTAFAFGLLTVSLALGAAFVEDVRAQHLSHKIVFSALAWGVFAVVIFGRWRWDWRGRHGVKYVLSGFTLLALAFFGTKFVLEIVLHRA
ncbi:MAG: inner membrane protein YpjD [Gammaproteobacteria bacterium]